MKNILFVTYDGLTDPLGRSQILPYIIGLTEKGYQFTIVSCEKPDKFKLYKKKVDSLLASHPIRWIPLQYHKDPPVLSSVYDLIRMNRKIRQLNKNCPFDMIHTRAGTPALIGLGMKKKYGIPFLNDIRDFYADSRIDSGAWKKNNLVFRLVYNFFKKKEEEAIMHNDGIVCLTQKAEKIIKSNSYYQSSVPISVIPCSVDLQLFNSNSLNVSKKEILKTTLNIKKDEIVFTYLGSTGSWYLLDEMMIFFNQITVSLPSSKFLFISNQDEKEIIRAAEKNNIPKEKIIVTQAEREEIPILLSLASYSVFFIKPCLSKQASSPTKHAEVMAMGIPVISNSGIGDVETIIKKYNSGFIINDFTKKEYLRVAEEIRSTKRINEKSIRKGAEDYFDLKKAIEKYNLLYQTILNKNKQKIRVAL
jgi:glycosyltransferase involved in cell wall biosynthesis